MEFVKKNLIFLFANQFLLEYCIFVVPTKT